MNDTKQTICIERERLQQSRQLDNVSRSLQKTMAELQGIEELQPIPADLADITTTWLQQRLDECTAPIKADKSLTSDERRERLQPWKAIHKRAKRLVSIVAGILDTNLDVVFSVEENEDGQQRYFIPEEQIEELARQRATHDVPPEALEWLELIQKIREKVENLREWEQAHNVRRRNLGELFNTDWQGIAWLWISGNALADPISKKYEDFFPGQMQGTLNIGRTKTNQ